MPALPEKGIPSTVDGGEPKLLSPLDTLEAHQKGAAVMAASPDGRFMATGGADGLVCLWMVYENQVGGWVERITNRKIVGKFDRMILNSINQVNQVSTEVHYLEHS